MKNNFKEKQAKKRAKEATKGVIDSIKWLDEMDTVIIVLDATKDPYSYLMLDLKQETDENFVCLVNLQLKILMPI